MQTAFVPPNRRFTVISLLILSLSCTKLVYSQENFNKNEFAARRAKVFDKIGESTALIFANEEHPHAVKYRESPDFFYLTGVEEPGAVLILLGTRKMAFLLAPKKPEWKIKSEGPGILDIKEAATIYGFSVRPIDDLYSGLAFFPAAGKPVYVQLSAPDQLQYGRDEVAGNDADGLRMPFARVSRIKHILSSIRNMEPRIEFRDIGPILDELRWVKTPYEIDRMRMAGKIGADGVMEAIKGTRPGMYEYELEAAARFVYVKRGARGDAFMPIVASGPNTLIAHYSKNNRRMQAGDIVYMDYGADYDYYTSDITRVWPVGEKFSPDQEKMYACVLEASLAIIAAIKPGVTVANLKDVAQPIYKKHGFEKEFLATNRYIGHFIGMSVHDVGDESKPFVAGVVYNVEPTLSIEEKKIALRLEDSVLVTPTGSENLTAAVPTDIASIYRLMKQKPLTTTDDVATN